jgi:hypothetical protein
VLEHRINLATENQELRAEMMQDAIARIIDGEGTCASIDLRAQQNRQMMYGRFNQLGSDSNAMRILNGQPPLKD